MTHPLIRLCRTCWGWRFYLAGLLGWSALELALYLRHDHWAFIRTSADIGRWGIGLTIVYKVVIITLMVATKPKTTLDRRFIWHLASVLALFAYAFGLYLVPEWYGQPRPRDVAPIGEPPLRLVIAAAIWFQIWGFVMWSAIAVLNALYRERWRYVRLGLWRILKIRASEYAD